MAKNIAFIQMFMTFLPYKKHVLEHQMAWNHSFQTPHPRAPPAEFKLTSFDLFRL